MLACLNTTENSSLTDASSTQALTASSTHNHMPHAMFPRELRSLAEVIHSYFYPSCGGDMTAQPMASAFYFLLPKK
jgi:hypothetical protein